MGSRLPGEGQKGRQPMAPLVTKGAGRGGISGLVGSVPGNACLEAPAPGCWPCVDRGAAGSAPQGPPCREGRSWANSVLGPLWPGPTLPGRLWAQRPTQVLPHSPAGPPRSAAEAASAPA